MKYVLDCSVALKWVLPEKDTAKALRIWSECQSAVHQLFAPDFFPVEISHALTRAERKGILSVGHAELHLMNVLSVPPTLFDTLPLLRRAVEISSRFRIGVYDCVYVALAERKSCELLTADDKLVHALQGDFPFLIALSSIP